MSCDNLSREQRQVYKLLLTPIECDKKASGMSLKDGKIFSGQTYISSYADPDMSDFAVGFYEILYRDVLDNGEMLDSHFFFKNTDFAGDTMNSFNSIANVTPGAGTNADERPPFEKWPIFLQEYSRQFRCLANYWVIPMKLGRQSMKFNRYDSVDLCLSVLESDYQNCMANYVDYCSKVPDFTHFCTVHFISTWHDREMVLQLYRNMGGEKLVKLATEAIHIRALRIASSCYSEKLFHYFVSLGLV